MRSMNNLFLLSLICFYNLIFLQLTTVISSSNKVLIIGGTGRVGSTIVATLLEKGITTNLLVRDIDKARNNAKLIGSNFFKCDVSDKNSIAKIIEASKDCGTIIDVHGVNPPRFIKFKDIFIHPNNNNDYNHPYHVNYLGVKRVLAAMKINKVKKLIRITGALVDKNEFLPFIVLFNFLLSKTNKWHTLSEKAIRESNIDYTVIRPTGIRDVVTLSSNNENNITNKLVMLPGDSNILPKVPSQISVTNVASICIQAINDERLSKSTIICSTEVGEGPTEWESMISTRESWKDSKVIGKRYYNLAMLSYGILITTSLTILYKLLHNSYRFFLKYILKL